MVKGDGAEILRPGFSSLVGHRFYQTKIILNLAYQFFFDYDKIVYNILCLTLDMIRGYEVSFSVKTTPKSAFQDLKLARQYFLLPLEILRQEYFDVFWGSHLRTRAAMAKWFKAPVLET